MFWGECCENEGAGVGIAANGTNLVISGLPNHGPYELQLPLHLFSLPLILKHFQVIFVTIRLGFVQIHLRFAISFYFCLF